MAIIQETIPAGKLIFRKITGKKQTEGKKNRAKRYLPTSEEVERNNQRYAERDLLLKINHNFKEDDWHLVFTYRGIEPTQEEASEHLASFKRRLRTLYRKHNFTLKWIEATEYENKRIHHHFIISRGVDLREIKDAWGKGKILASALYAEGNYRELAAYLIKETSKTIKTNNPFSAKRFRCSRTVNNPPVFRQEVKLSKLLDDPKPIKGYYIDQDTIHTGRNPLSGRQYIEFYMLPLAGEEQAKKIHGRKVKYIKESTASWLRKNTPRQIEIDIDIRKGVPDELVKGRPGKPVPYHW